MVDSSFGGSITTTLQIDGLDSEATCVPPVRIESAVQDLQKAEDWEWKDLTMNNACTLRKFFDASLAWVLSCEAYCTDLVHRPHSSSYIILKGLLVIRQPSGDARGSWRLLPPLFFAMEDNLPFRIIGVIKDVLERLPDAFFDFVSDKYLSLIGQHELAKMTVTLNQTDVGEWDFVYSKQGLLTLSGSKALHEKRRQARIFEANFMPTVIALTPDCWSDSLLQRCMLVLHKWVTEREARMGGLDGRCHRDNMFTSSLLANVAHHPNLRGVLIEVNGQPLAFAIGELEQGGQMYLLHIEKAVTEGWRGIYPYLRRAHIECWQHEQFTFVNAEQDTGNTGLRIAKQRYGPIALNRKWQIAKGT